MSTSMEYLKHRSAGAPQPMDELLSAAGLLMPDHAPRKRHRPDHDLIDCRSEGTSARGCANVRYEEALAVGAAAVPQYEDDAQPFLTVQAVSTVDTSPILQLPNPVYSSFAA